MKSGDFRQNCPKRYRVKPQSSQSPIFVKETVLNIYSDDRKGAFEALLQNLLGKSTEHCDCLRQGGVAGLGTALRNTTNRSKLAMRSQATPSR